MALIQMTVYIALCTCIHDAILYKLIISADVTNFSDQTITPTLGSNFWNQERVRIGISAASYSRPIHPGNLFWVHRQTRVFKEYVPCGMLSMWCSIATGWVFVKFSIVYTSDKQMDWLLKLTKCTTCSLHVHAGSTTSRSLLKSRSKETDLTETAVLLQDGATQHETISGTYVATPLLNSTATFEYVQNPITLRFSSQIKLPQAPYLHIENHWSNHILLIETKKVILLALEQDTNL